MSTPATATWPQPTIDHAIADHVRNRPEATAVEAPHVTLNWQQLDAAGGRAAHIVADAGGPGTRVAWLGANDVGYLYALLGAWRQRAALVGLNWRLPDAELTQLTELTNVTLIFCSEAFADRARAIAGARARVVVVDQSTTTPWPDLETEPALAPAPDDIAIVFFTSGSTGLPKAVPYARIGVEIGAATPTGFGYTTESRLLIVPPVFHLAGAYWAWYGLLFGATQVYIADSSPAGIVDAFHSRGITHAVLVPTIIRAILDELREHPVDFPALEQIAYGASSITTVMLREALAAFDCRLTQVMGTTEAGGVVTNLPPEDHLLEGPHVGRLASAGFCVPGAELEIRDVITGEVLPTGKSGDLWFRTDFMAHEYLNQPEKSAEVFVDGWVNTRDVGHLDEDGYVYMEGRSDDMIVTGGENVHPQVVEEVLASLSAVQECAVFGMPDDRWGQAVAAAIVPRDPDLTTADVKAFCKSRLAGYQVPKQVYFVDDLPKTASGKITRVKLPQTVKED